MSKNVNLHDWNFSGRLNPLFAAKAELDKLLRRRKGLDEKIKVLEEAIAILAPAYETENCASPVLPRALNDGMTARIYEILVNNGDREFSPTDIRDLLVAGGFSLDGRSNPMAEIHQVLKRLAKNEDLLVRILPGTGPKNAVLYKYDAASFWNTIRREGQEDIEEMVENGRRARIGT
jgi:hypothetical protein